MSKNQPAISQAKEFFKKGSTEFDICGIIIICKKCRNAIFTQKKYVEFVSVK